MSGADEQCSGVYRHGQVELDRPVGWASGARVVVKVVDPLPQEHIALSGPVVIAGFGLAGRYVADLLEHGQIPFVVVEKNPVTVETQACLGRQIILGDVSTAEILKEAGLDQASILALTIPDEKAVLKAIEVARRLNPDIFIIARTNYTSSGIRASQIGANEVIKAEQAVALQFYERLSRRMGRL